VLDVGAGAQTTDYISVIIYLSALISVNMTESLTIY